MGAHYFTLDTSYQNLASLLLGSLHCKSTNVKKQKKKKSTKTPPQPNIELSSSKNNIEQTSQRLGKN